MELELLKMLNENTPILLLVGILFLLVRIQGTVKTLADEITELKNGITWGDTCNARHDEINRRLAKVEKASGLNGDD